MGRQHNDTGGGGGGGACNTAQTRHVAAVLLVSSTAAGWLLPTTGAVCGDVVFSVDTQHCAFEPHSQGAAVSFTHAPGCTCMYSVVEQHQSHSCVFNCVHDAQR